MTRRRRVVLAGVLAAALAAAAAVAVVTRGSSPLPGDEARAYLEAWARGDVGALRARASRPPADFEDWHRRFRDELGIAASRFDLRDVARSQDGPTATFSATHRVRGLGEWVHEGNLTFVREDGRWLVRWAPATLHPLLADGDQLARERTRPPRAPILGGDGQPLSTEREVVAIGVQPSRVRNRADVAAALQAHLGVDPAAVDRALDAPGVRPDHFVPIVDVRPERYEGVRPGLAPVPGIVFRRRTARLTPAEGFAAHTLGRVGEITAEQLEELGPTYQVGDLVGRSGIELAYEADLSGVPAGELRARRRTGDVVLHRFPGAPPRPVRTTLREDVQRAADAALAGVAQPAAIVAVDAATGAVLAVASRPLGDALNRALAGRYPPGSTFKVVTAEAALAAGTTPASPIRCPPEVTIGGKRFRNFEGEALGDTTFRLAFAHSCNTAFVTVPGTLPQGGLGDAARRFGFETRYATGLASGGASFPTPRDAAEAAAAAIGQGRVLASPVHMASVAAAVADGTWRSPHVVAERGERATAPLTPAALEPLRTLMRAVVTEGTGTAAAGVPDLAGKTGTAEFGSGDPLPTHAWFVGFRRAVAFAVVVEGGGVGGRVAAPFAARFASALDTPTPTAPPPSR